jgi:hypothetical protein
MNILFFWNNRDKCAGYIDAREIANRDEIKLSIGKWYKRLCEEINVDILLPRLKWTSILLIFESKPYAVERYKKLTYSWSLLSSLRIPSHKEFSFGEEKGVQRVWRLPEEYGN